ncbi:MAG: RNA-binding domain-containing protein [Micavibrio sp.]
MTPRKQRKGSLTDDEVGIARNLLARDYKNQDVLGLINTTRRLEGREETNGGRISEVKTNKPRYKGIKAVSDDVANAYVDKAQKPSAFTRIDTDPLREEILKALFPKAKGKTDNLDITETDHIECKETFGGQHWINNCIKAIVAFSNNKGGYIAFGIKDNTWDIVGIDRSAFEKLDRRVINQAIRSNLSCGVDFDTVILEFGVKAIGIMYVHPAKIKPVMFIKQNNAASATEGHIYYRYQGENRLIGPTELQHLIEERIRTLSETILTKHLQNILSNGIENSAVLNLDTGEVDGKSGSFIIDETLLPKLSFVKEGEFVEKSGAPALKLVGEIRSSGQIVTVKREDLIKLYPFSWREVVAKVRKKLPAENSDRVSKVIKAEGIKENTKYAAYNFRTKQHSDEYEKSRKVKSGTPCIYNQAAVDLIIEKLTSVEAA